MSFYAATIRPTTTLSKQPIEIVVKGKDRDGYPFTEVGHCDTLDEAYDVLIEQYGFGTLVIDNVVSA